MKLKTHTLSLGLLLFAACGERVDAGDELDTASQSLAYGMVVPEQTERALGLVTLPGCSAALLTSDWVITAAHGVSGASSMEVRMADGHGGTVMRVSDRIVTPPKPANAKADLGLIHLGGAAPADWPQHFVRTMDERAPSSLLGAQLACYGRGPGSIENGNWAGYGPWRAATFTVDGVATFPNENDVVTFRRTAQGQIIGPGDSGGPCFAEVGGTIVHVGNHSAVGYGVDAQGRIIDSPDMRGYDTATSFFRAWILEQLSARPMFLRGTMNGWGTTEMTASGSRFEVGVSLAAGHTYEYKYDSSGQWLSGANWGRGPVAGVAQANGANLSYTATVSGPHRFVFDDAAKTYQVIPPAMVTLLRIHTDVGFGNFIAVRGSVRPFTWTQGLTARWTAGNVWELSTSEIPVGTRIEFKPLRNDSAWSMGANYTVTAGQTVDVYPTF